MDCSAIPNLWRRPNNDNDNDDDDEDDDIIIIIIVIGIVIVHSFIHSFIPAISIAPLQVLYYSEAGLLICTYQAGQ